ncbi:glycosyl transferase family A [Salinigranum rubrum]|uniref:Glycosyl transferase family A n=1 Tax=Salinigranum rubrum TaxID=755307 RepID=A0A2I8VIV6_9EURY|nr:glucosyl-dolichyl phosphate glucuronosyltransferase [Salinigranum rubrum]AUV81824.1 glycosyl transferase family A [Salinigranum rubrum]
MKVSVVICAYSPDVFDHLVDAVNSVLAGTYDDVEVVVVVDGDESLCERIRDRYESHDDVVLHCNDENLGLSASRNEGIERAAGDVVAFLDDDAVAHPEWVERLVSLYRRHDAVAAGGRMTGRWVAGKPTFLPEEFYWLVGVTHRGFPTEECEVRNTFGSNISFRREVFEELGGFEPNLGRFGEKHLQGEETEFAARVRQRYGEGVWYDPDAVVEHKVFDYRTKPGWLVKRAFWQGYSKRVMADVLPEEDGGEEGDFLKQLLVEFVPDRVGDVVRERRSTDAVQLLSLGLLTAVVGLGYVYGVVTRRL